MNGLFVIEVTMRGINTNNYAESAIARLKDIVFKGLQFNVHSKTAYGDHV